MASLDIGGEAEFGHLTCKLLDNIPLERFKNDFDTESVSKKLVMLEERRYNRPLYYQAMKTMYATILYKGATNSPESNYESIRYLREVLEANETNITALSDLVYIYAHTGSLRKADYYKKKLKEILEGNTTNHLALARAYYDRAHIIRHFEQDKRQFSYFDLLQKAKYHIGEVNSNADSIDTERGEILFHFSLSLYRKYSQKTEFGLLQEAEIEHSNKLLEDGIDSFIDVINISESSCDCKALSYIFIAILLRHKNTFDQYIGERTVYVNERLVSLDIGRKECLEGGLLLAKDDSNVLRRVASEYIHLDRLAEAEEYFKRSLLKEKSWFAYRHQGRLYVKMYYDSKDDEYLSKARCSFKKAYRIKQTHADLSDHGHVYLLQAEKRRREDLNDPEAIHLLDKAKLNFANAATLTDSDDYFNPIETYKRWGRCLELTEEYRGRDIVRQMSEQREELLIGTLKDGSTCQIEVIEQSSTSAVFSSATNASRPNSSATTFKHDFYVITSQSDREWVGGQLLPKLEGEYNLKGFLNWRDKVLGQDFVSTVVEAMCYSRYIIIVLSPEFLTCPWCDYELSLALNKAVLHIPDYTVLPIMLQSCKIPDKLQPFCEESRLITGVDGAIDARGWQQLQQTFT